MNNDATNYVYMVRCKDGSLYTGWSTDPVKRAKAHNRGKGAKYTRARRPVNLVYVEECESKEAALKREVVIKKMSKEEKERLVGEYHQI